MRSGQLNSFLLFTSKQIKHIHTHTSTCRWQKQIRHGAKISNRASPLTCVEGRGHRDRNTYSTCLHHTACVKCESVKPTAQAWGIVRNRAVSPGKVRDVWITKENLTQTEGIPQALPPVLCPRRPNLILLIGSWGYSKEPLVSPSSGPGIPFYVILTEWKPQSLAINLF